MIIIKDCGHFLHEDQPQTTKKYLLRILQHIDGHELTLEQSETDEFEIKHCDQ